MTERRVGIAVCRIIRPPDLRRVLASADVASGAICVCCPALLRPVPAAVVVVEGPAAIRLTAGVCPRCARRTDRELIATAYSSLRTVFPSLRPIGRGGSA